VVGGGVYRPDFAGRAREEPARTSEVPDPKPDNPDVRQVLEKALENERAFEQQLDNWLAQRRKD
jgi:ferritin